MFLSKVRSVFALVALCSANAVAIAQDAPIQTPGTAAPAGASPGWMNLVLLGGMIFFMWMFMIRPQAKRQKEHKAFLDSLQTGMEVITSSGFIGKVTNVTDTIVTLDLGNGSVRILKSAVSGRLDAKGVAGATSAATVVS